MLFNDTATPAVSEDILDGTFQAKNRNALFFFSSSTSNIFLHTFTPLLDGTERPTMALQVDGIGDNILYKGVVVDSLAVEGALKGMVTADADLLGFNETGSQEESGLTLPDSDPMIFANGATAFGGKVYAFTRSLKVELKNNHQGDLGYGQGSLGRVGHCKDTFDGDGTLQSPHGLGQLCRTGEGLHLRHDRPAGDSQGREPRRGDPGTHHLRLSVLWPDRG